MSAQQQPETFAEVVVHFKSDKNPLAFIQVVASMFPIPSGGVLMIQESAGPKVYWFPWEDIDHVDITRSSLNLAQAH